MNSESEFFSTSDIQDTDLPNFSVIETDTDSGVPKYVEIRPLVTLANFNESSVWFNEMIHTLSVIIRNRYARELSLPFSDPRTRPIGILLLVNDGNGRSNSVQIDYDNPISDQVFQTLMDSIAQSNTDFNYNDMVFYFYYDPNSIVPGSGNGKNIGETYIVKQTNETYEFEGVKITCAAFCLAWGERPDYYSNDWGKERCKKQCLQRALNLQLACEFKEKVVYNDFQKYVDYVKNKRVVILSRAHVIGGTVFETEDFEEPEFAASSKIPPNIIYIFHDLTTHHYHLVKSLPKLYREKFFMRGVEGFCHKCRRGIANFVDHPCYSEEMEERREEKKEKQKIHKMRNCFQCGKMHGPNKVCDYAHCRGCKGYVKNGNYNHRCPLIVEEKKDFIFSEPAIAEWVENNGTSFELEDEGETIAEFGGGSGKKKKKGPKIYHVWAWDIESRLEVECGTLNTMFDYEVDEDYYYRPDVDITRIKPVKINHAVNLICVQNIFTYEKKTFYGDNCFVEFIDFMLAYNKGVNILFAHNSSGYDSRLLMQHLINTRGIIPKVIARGSKYMKLQIGDLIFCDSMNHLNGSLRNLAGAFAQGVPMEKGFFPYLFNTLENQDYEGPIPDKKYFSIPTSCKNEKTYKELLDWYDEQQGKTWNLKKELIKYCENDVEILATILRTYHDKNIEKGRRSPLLFVTGPSFTHYVIGRQMTLRMKLPPCVQGYYDKKDKKFNIDEKAAKIYMTACEEAAKHNFCTLKDEEDFFARAALRGGRTDARCFYKKLSDEEIAQGHGIKMVDIVSEYPFQQVDRHFPVGYPEINIYGSNFKIM